MELLQKFIHIESMKKKNVKIFLSKSLSDDSVENYVSHKLSLYNIDYFNSREFNRHNLSLDFSKFYHVLNKFFKIQDNIKMKWGSVEVNSENIDLYLEGNVNFKNITDNYKKNAQSLLFTEFVDDFKIFVRNEVTEGINFRAQCSLSIEKYISYILEIDHVDNSSRSSDIKPSVVRRGIDA